MDNIEVNPFTYSLAIYPLVVVRFASPPTGRAGARYFSVVMTLGVAMLAFFSLSPMMGEQSADVILPYANTVFGCAAFTMLLTLILVPAGGALYSFQSWVANGREFSRPGAPKSAIPSAPQFEV